MRSILLAVIGLAATVYADIIVCNKNCANDFAKCVISTQDEENCSKNTAFCALDCLKEYKIYINDDGVEHKTGTCQKDCAIDFAKCLI